MNCNHVSEERCKVSYELGFATYKCVVIRSKCNLYSVIQIDSVSLNAEVISFLFISALSKKWMSEEILN